MFTTQEELCSDSVERIVVNPNAAYDKFKDKHVSTKGLGQFKMQMYSLKSLKVIGVLYKPPTYDLTYLQISQTASVEAEGWAMSQETMKL